MNGPARNVPNNMMTAIASPAFGGNPSQAPMNILANPAVAGPRYQQQQQQQQRPIGILRQTQPPQQQNIQAQMQGMQFPGTIQQGNAVRRVQSQPNIGPMANPVAGTMPLNLGPGQMQAQAVAREHRLRIQQQQAALMQAEMRNQQGPPNMQRAPSAQSQVMSSLGQPASMPPQNAFSNGAPPQLSSSPGPQPTHTPSLSMATPGPSHTPVNRPRMPQDDGVSFMGYPGTQFSGNNPPRVPSASNPSVYPFGGPSSSTPTPMPMDIVQTSPSSGMHSQGGTPNRSSFMSTQSFDMSNGMDVYSSPFNMGPPPTAVAPPRPPSHATNPHQPQPNPPPSQGPQQQPLPHQQSPPQSTDQMNVHPQRPQSQPQQQPIPGRPPSQAGTTHTHTPRSMQIPLPPSNLAGSGSLTATGRIPTAPQGAGPPPGPSMMPPMGPRPLAMGGVPPPPSLNSQMPVDAPQSGVRGIVPAQSINTGLGLMRLLQFSGVLSSETPMKFQLSWWSDLVKEYFTPNAELKLTLWKDNAKNEAKPFQIGVPIMPRFFLVTTQSGVKSMSFTLDGARERPYQPSQQQPHTMIECVSAVWTFRYTNGYIVHLRGPLTAHVVAASPVPPGTLNINPVQQWSLKFDELAFDATVHEKFVQLDAILGQRTISPLSPRIRNMNLAMHNSPGTTAAQIQQAQHQSDEEKRYEEPRMLINHASIPGEPVNAFGIPQATMRCLELAESVTSMGDLIVYSTETQLGPMDALKKLAQRIREQNAAGAAGGSQQQSQQQQQQQQLQQPPPLPLQQQQQQIPPPQFMNTMPQNMNPSNPNNMNNSIAGPSNPNPFSYQQPGTLYSSAPPSVTNPPNLIASSSMSSPQNTSSSSTANSPEKQLKTIPQQQQQAQQQQGGQGPQAQQQAPTPSQSGAAASPAVSSGTTTNTPALANATPKRKLGDASSPTTGTSDQPPPKRNARKRGRTNTNSGAG